jgi:hypothetical protein
VRSGAGTYLPEVPELLWEKLERRPVECSVQVSLVPEPQDWRLLEAKQRGSPLAGEWPAERQVSELVPKWEQRAVEH